MLTEELQISERINKKFLFTIILIILLIISFITLLVLQNKKTTQTKYLEYTTDFTNPIIDILESNTKISGIKLYEENQIINFIYKTFTLLQGRNPYIKDLSFYMEVQVRNYYKNKIATTIFHKNIFYNKIIPYTRNIKIVNIKELKNRIINIDDGIIEKVYEIDIIIREFPNQKIRETHQTPAKINIITSYHNQDKIIDLTKITKNYSSINPLNLKIKNLFITTK